MMKRLFWIALLLIAAVTLVTIYFSMSLKTSSIEAPSNSPPDLPMLPWPPPKPSSLISLPDEAKGDSNHLVDVYERISFALHQSGYGEQRVYGVPASGDEGFAIVTRLERFDKNGVPLDDDTRFLPPDLEDTSFNLTEFIKRLFVAPQGYFRFAIFIITDLTYIPNAPEIDSEGAQTLLEEGVPRLPDSFEQVSSSGYHVDVLIYEYLWDTQKDEAKPIAPGRLTAYQHLAGAGLDSTLGLK